MRLIAKTPLNYRQRDLAVGDTFDAVKQDARLLVAIGRATLVEQSDDEPKEQPKRRGRPRKYQTRELSAEGA